MRKIVHRTFFAWEHEKEEDWLNSMAAQGWNLVDTTPFRYVFEQSAPGQYQYRLELLARGSAQATERYLRFLEETGVEHIATYFNGWAYFRKKTADGPFALFSDIDSLLRHFARIRSLLLGATVAVLAALVVQIVCLLSAGAVTWSAVAGMALVLAAAVFCGSGLLRIQRHMQRLRREREIHE